MNTRRLNLRRSTRQASKRPCPEDRDTETQDVPNARTSADRKISDSKDGKGSQPFQLLNDEAETVAQQDDADHDGSTTEMPQSQITSGSLQDDFWLSQQPVGQQEVGWDCNSPDSLRRELSRIQGNKKSSKVEINEIVTMLNKEKNSSPSRTPPLLGLWMQKQLATEESPGGVRRGRGRRGRPAGIKSSVMSKDLLLHLMEDIARVAASGNNRTEDLDEEELVKTEKDNIVDCKEDSQKVGLVIQGESTSTTLTQSSSNSPVFSKVLARTTVKAINQPKSSPVFNKPAVPSPARPVDSPREQCTALWDDADDDDSFLVQATQQILGESPLQHLATQHILRNNPFQSPQFVQKQFKTSTPDEPVVRPGKQNKNDMETTPCKGLVGQGRVARQMIKISPTGLPAKANLTPKKDDHNMPYKSYYDRNKKLDHSFEKGDGTYNAKMQFQAQAVSKPEGRPSKQSQFVSNPSIKTSCQTITKTASNQSQQIPATAPSGQTLATSQAVQRPVSAPPQQKPVDFQPVQKSTAVRPGYKPVTAQHMQTHATVQPTHRPAAAEPAQKFPTAQPVQMFPTAQPTSRPVIKPTAQSIQEQATAYPVSRFPTTQSLQKFGHAELVQKISSTHSVHVGATTQPAQRVTTSPTVQTAQVGSRSNNTNNAKTGGNFMQKLESSTTQAYVSNKGVIPSSISVNTSIQSNTTVLQQRTAVSVNPSVHSKTATVVGQKSDASKTRMGTGHNLINQTNKSDNRYENRSREVNQSFQMDLFDASVDDLLATMPETDLLMDSQAFNPVSSSGSNSERRTSDENALSSVLVPPQPGMPVSDSQSSGESNSQPKGTQKYTASEIERKRQEALKRKKARLKQRNS